ncbi:MAG: GNAT family N-acetyltransferase [Thermoplasmata archaeon]
MDIRKLRTDDYDRIIELWEKAGLSHRPEGRDSRNEMVRQINEFGDLFLGAFVDGVLVGVIVGSDDGRKGWINRLAVLPDHQRQGIAIELIQAVEEALETRNRRIISVLIEPPNDSSISLFEKAGYKAWDGMAYLSKREDEKV